MFSMQTESSTFSKADTLFEDFSIENLVYFIKYLNVHSTRQNRIEVYEHLFLRNLLLCRRLQDGGFYQFLCKSVYNNKDYLKFAIQIIRYEIINRLINLNPYLNPLAKLDSWEEVNNPKNLPGFEKDIQNLSEEYQSKNQNLSVKYLDECITFARQMADLDRLKAIIALKKDFETLEFHLWEIVVDPFGEDPLTIENCEGIKRRLEYTKVMNNTAYITPKRFGLNPEEVPESIYLNNIIICEMQSILGYKPEKSLLFNKFMKDLIGILQIKWFEMHTFSEMWETINGIYPYTLEKDDFCNIFSEYSNIKIDSKLIQQYFQEIFSVEIKDVVMNSEVRSKEIADFYHYLLSIFLLVVEFYETHHYSKFLIEFGTISTN